MGDYRRERRKSEGRSQLGEGKKKWRTGGSARRGRMIAMSSRRVKVKRVERGRRKVEERGRVEWGS